MQSVEKVEIAPMRVCEIAKDDDAPRSNARKEKRKIGEAIRFLFII